MYAMGLFVELCCTPWFRLLSVYLVAHIPRPSFGFVSGYLRNYIKYDFFCDMKYDDFITYTPSRTIQNKIPYIHTMFE